MKRYIAIIIVVILTPIISFSQNKIQDGIYMSPAMGGSSWMYEFKKDTFIIDSFGDCIVDGRGTSQKGLYTIKGKKIFFKPLPPSHFQKSVVQYKKEDHRFNRYDFEISIKELENDSVVKEFEVQLYDSLNTSMPFQVISGANGKLHFSYGGIQKITKICLKSTYLEDVQLDFDPLFYGRHLYTIKLAPMYRRYVDQGPFSFDIIDITPKFIKINFWGDPLTLVKTEFVTNEFMKTGIFIEGSK